MASPGFQLLIIQLQDEFNALQAENFALRSKLQTDLFEQDFYTPQEARLQTEIPEHLPQTPRQSDLAEESDQGPKTPRASKQAEWKSRQAPQMAPDINPQCVADMEEEYMLDEENDAETQVGPSTPKNESDAMRLLRTDTERSSKPSMIQCSDPIISDVAKSGFMQRYTKMLHSNRRSHFGNRNAIVDTKRYRRCVAVVIISDCAMIMWNCYYYSRDEAPLGPRMLAVGICVFFIADGALRANYYVRVSSGLHHSWRDIFDFLCLAIMIFDEICLLANGITFKFSWASIMRGFRVLRLFYAFRYIVKSIGASELLREFDWLLNVLMSTSGWRTVLCVFFYIAIVFAICSVALTDGALYLECESLYTADDNDLCKHFGTLRNTFLTLFKVTYGGILWGDILDSLDKLSTLYAFVFALFLLAYSVLLVNTGIGAILRICQESTDQQKHKDRLRKQAKLVEQEVRLMEQLFMEIDVNDNGAISRAEFELALKDPHMTSTLSVLKLHIFDLAAIFPLFDLNGSGEISLDEFVLGCVKMKGPARALDVHQLQASIDQIWELVSGVQFRKSNTLPSALGDEPIEILAPRSTLKKPTTSTVWKNTPSVQKQRTLGFGGEDFLQQRSIPKSEMRAMSLRELKRIPGLIKHELRESAWVDMHTGAVLTSGDVTLYHFNHYCMCPRTTPNGITLEGLDAANYEIGDEVVQYDSERQSATPLASGTVLTTSSDGNIHIAVKQGHFKSDAQPVQVNGQIRGIPANVKAPQAISFKEHISSEALQPRWFCSHWWGEKIVHFVKCCEEHAWRRRLGPVEAAYWVCAYANRQYDISAEISDDPTTSSFCKAMELAEGVLVILDTNATPFTRIWCCFEMYLTIMTGTKALDIATIRELKGSEVAILLSDGPLPCETQMAKTERERHFPMHLLVHGMRADLRQGRATVQSDRDKILWAIHNASPEIIAGVSNRKTIRDMFRPSEHTSQVLQVEEANGALNAVFAQAAWIHALHRKVDLEDIDQNGLSLPEVLSYDTRHQLVFSFEMYPDMSNSDLLLFARGLSPSYKHVHLSFGNCTNITDKAMRDLAEYLPHHIETCRLDFVGCSSITSRGLANLAKGLPSSISNLRLDFACCPEIDMVGIKLLAEHLPTSIKKFYATFPGTQVDRNFRSIDELQAVCGKSVLDRARSRLGFAAQRGPRKSLRLERDSVVTLGGS